MRPLRWFTLLLCVASAISLPAQNFAVLADHLYTMAEGTQGGPGIVLIRDGKIEAVRPGSHQSSPEGYTLLKAAFVTPGLIDTDTTAGISGAFNIPADQDQDEATDPNTADVRTLDSFNPNERLLKVLNQYGVTTVQSAPGTAQSYRWSRWYFQDCRNWPHARDGGATGRSSGIRHGL